MILNFADRHYKKLAIIPVILLVFSVAVLVNNTLSYGSVLKRDTELVGGKMISFAVLGADLAEVRSLVPQASGHMKRGVNHERLVEIHL